MSAYQKLKSIIGTFLFFTGLPALSSYFAPMIGYDGLYAFFITLIIVWIFSIECRLIDKQDKETNGK